MPSNAIKHIFGSKSIYDGTAKLDFISIGVVIDVEDKGQAGRILVDIKGVDDKTNNSDRSWAFPFLPKHLQVMPKVGESVFVIKLDLNDKTYVNRYWVGPIISQPQKLNKDPHFFTSQAALFRNVNAAPLAGVELMFWYCSSASVPPPPEMNGGLIVIVVAESTLITRKVLFCAVACLVMRCTDSTLATVKQSPADTPVVVLTVIC